MYEDAEDRSARQIVQENQVAILEILDRISVTLNTLDQRIDDLHQYHADLNATLIHILRSIESLGTHLKDQT